MTVKDIHARDQQRVQDLRDKGYTVEIIWEKDCKLLSLSSLKLKPIQSNIAPTLTLKNI